MGVTRDGREGTLRFDDDAGVAAALADASCLLSSIPPAPDGADPALARHGAAIAAAPARWTGYWSATGVYGDADGAWVDERAPVLPDHPRTRAEAAWRSVRPQTCILRIAGIYGPGPGRSVLDRLRAGTQAMVVKPGHVFSRIHVDDLVALTLAAAASGARTAGVMLNAADDAPGPQADVVAHGAALLGLLPPPPVAFADAALSPMARRFWSASRRIANGRAKALTGWAPAYPSYREGLTAILAETGAGEAATPAAGRS